MVHQFGGLGDVGGGAHDAFLTAFERIAEFRGEGTFASWVGRIAARLYLRRLQRERRLAALPAEVVEDGQTQSCESDGGIDLEGALRAPSAAAGLWVSFCFGAGFSHSEAAVALKLALGTVKSHVKRGLEKLRVHLAPADGPRAEGRRGHA